jgi:hypothetical protein
MSLSINKSVTRKFVLAAASKRAHKFTRVKASFYNKADANYKVWLMRYVEQLPSRGKTIE